MNIKLKVFYSESYQCVTAKRPESCTEGWNDVEALHLYTDEREYGPYKYSGKTTAHNRAYAPFHYVPCYPHFFHGKRIPEDEVDTWSDQRHKKSKIDGAIEHEFLFRTGVSCLPRFCRTNLHGGFVSPRRFCAINQDFCVRMEGLGIRTGYFGAWRFCPYLCCEGSSAADDNSFRTC